MNPIPLPFRKRGKRADPGGIIIASLHGEARRWARKRDQTDADRAAALGEPRQLASGRADLLAHAGGITEGFAEGEPADQQPG